MYFLSNKIKGIVAFEITNFSIVLIEKKSANNYRLIQNEKSILEFNFTSLTKGLFSHIVVSDDDNNIYIFDKYVLLDKIEGYSLSEKSIRDNEIVISKRISRGIYDQFIYNLFDKTINKVAFIPNLIFNKQFFFIFFDENKIVKTLSLLSDKFEWETNLSGRKYLINNEEQEAKIIALLGVYENHLLVWLAGDRLISIDTNNGTILYEILPFEGLVDVNGFQLWDFRDLFLEQEAGKIIMLNKLFYYEIDILTQQVEQCKSFYTGNAFALGRLPNMPEPPTDITFKKAVYTNDFIYFIGGYTFATNIVGVFNRKTYNIDWQESINLLETDNFNNFKDIQYAINKIYVLDTGNQLHIFEKEE